MICSLNTSTDCLNMCKKKLHSVIVRFVLDEEIQIVWGKGRMPNSTSYNISSQIAPQAQNAGADIKSFLCTEDTSNYTIKLSKDKLFRVGNPVVVPDKKGSHAPKDYLRVN